MSPLCLELGLLLWVYYASHRLFHNSVSQPANEIQCRPKINREKNMERRWKKAFHLATSGRWRCQSTVDKLLFHLPLGAQRNLLGCTLNVGSANHCQHGFVQSSCSFLQLRDCFSWTSRHRLQTPPTLHVNPESRLQGNHVRTPGQCPNTWWENTWC